MSTGNFVQAGKASVTVRGVCNWNDMGSLIRVETTLIGGGYVSILLHHVHPFMFIGHSDGLDQFQQENATPHMSRVATEWFQEHSSDFKHFHWPPKSPDVNINEHIWEALQRAVRKRSPPPRVLWICALQDLCPAGFMVCIASRIIHESGPCHVAFSHFCVLVGALHDVRQV